MHIQLIVLYLYVQCNIEYNTSLKQVIMRRARFSTGLDDFSDGAKIEDCTFQLIKTVGGEYLVDTIYKNSVKPNIENQVYSYEQLLSMSNFVIREDRLRKKYKTSKGVIRKLNQIRTKNRA